MCASRAVRWLQVMLGSEETTGELQAALARLEEIRSELEKEGREIRSGLTRLDRSLRQLDRRIEAIENSRIFRVLRWLGTPLLERRAKLGYRLLRSPVYPLFARVFSRRVNNKYEAWLVQERSSTPTPEWHRKRAQEFGRLPLLSVVVPVHNPTREWLETALDSVVAQTYPLWELCVCDDASREQWVSEYLAERASREPRMRFVRSPEHQGISGALNRAGELARGEYLVFLDHDDVLSPYALHYVAEILQDGDADLIYSDEDLLDPAGRRVEPIFKPDWSPDLLTGCMYLGHCLAASRGALVRAGWFRPEFDGSQDYDLALRVTDSSAVVRHIPRVLYHWRKHAGSTSANAGSKPYAHDAGRRALQDAVRRRNWQATVEDGPAPHTYRLRWQLVGEPRVSLIICSRTARLLNSCLRAIEKRTAYSHREVVAVQHETGDDTAMDRLLASLPVVRVHYRGAFNFSAINNLGAQAASGEILVFLNDDVQPLVPYWLASLVAQAQRPEVGIAGARLVYPAGSVQHAGIAIGIMDGCGHPYRHTYGSSVWPWLDLARNVSAVTGACLAIRKQVFGELGGFDASFPVNYNDADLCLRARRAGYEVIYEPAALLRHDECRTRSGGTRLEERERWYQLWGEVLDRGDPFYNPNLTRVREDAGLAVES